MPAKPQQPAITMNNESETNPAIKRMEEQYFGPQKHEAREIDRLPSVLGEVKCFVDIGSSLGQYAYYAGKSLQDADIYCIEPDPFKAAHLRQLAARWSRETDNRYHVIEKALDNKPGRLSFYFPTDHSSSGALFPLTESGDGWERVEVESDTLDSIFKGRAVDFVKIDVEGAEYRVLEGATKLLTDGGVRLLLEIAPWGDLEHHRRPSDVLALLENFGYTFSIFESHYLFYKGGIPVLFRLKNRLMRFILNHPRVKTATKRFYRLARR